MLQKQVGPVELRAWALASKDLAEKENFKGVAASVGTWVDLLSQWIDQGVCSIELRPVFADEYKLQQEVKRNGRTNEGT